jgi:hypothetical protein
MKLYMSQSAPRAGDPEVGCRYTYGHCLTRKVYVYPDLE